MVKIIDFYNFAVVSKFEVIAFTHRGDSGRIFLLMFYEY